MQTRNLFTTKTMQGVFVTLIGFLIQVIPTSNAFIDRKFDKQQAEDVKFFLSVVLVLCGSARTTYGRYVATGDVVLPRRLRIRRKP
jgi:hypothetical protein